MGDSATRHLVFVHGGGVGPWMWRRVTEELVGFEIHTPVLPGHGPDSSSFTTTAAAASDIAGQIGLERLDGEVTLVGFSAGGQVAVKLASMHPDRIARVCIVSSLLEPLRGGPALAAIVSAFAPLARLRSFARLQAQQLHIPDDDFERYLEFARAMSKRSLRNLLTATFTFCAPEEFRRNPRPLLLVAGSREQSALLNGMRRLASESVRARLEMREGADHGIPLEAPEWLATRLAEWLRAPRAT